VRSPVKDGSLEMVSNAVQLIAYADRLAGDIDRLHRLLDSEPWRGAFGGVHVLPFFTPFDGADAGFDPTDHTAVDPRLGTWESIGALAVRGDVMVDIIVNHVSASSASFVDWCARGEASPYAGMFLTMASVFPDGATERDLTAVYRPRPGVPFTPYRVAGEQRLVWTTFTPQQIDIDVSHPEAQRYLDAILDEVSASGVSMVRLDAVGYAIKTPGTSCFMTEDTYAFISAFTAKARAKGVEVLVEVHSYFARQIEIGSAVDRVYDFALPPLVLYALGTGDGGPLARWMGMRPSNAVTVLDTHDGIGVIDVGADQAAPGRPGLLTPSQVDELVESIRLNSGGTSVLATGAAASNLDLYQVNCTYFDALGGDEYAYLIARAIQFFVPGIPQVYYVGALAGRNDVGLLQRTGVGRDINRRYYSADEVAAEVERPVVAALFALCRFRSTLSVFDGAFTFAHDEQAPVFTMRWEADDAWAQLDVCLRDRSASVSWSHNGFEGRTDDLLAHPPTLR